MNADEASIDGKSLSHEGESGAEFRMNRFQLLKQPKTGASSQNHRFNMPRRFPAEIISIFKQ